jgi:hypothetical protein
MNPKLVICLAGIFFFGCAVWQPGSDPKGRSLIATADKVLVAVNSYVKEHATKPVSLSVLVPDYLPSLPNEPEIIYVPEKESMWFSYTPSWPQVGACSCYAIIGSLGFICGGYL